MVRKSGRDALLADVIYNLKTAWEKLGRCASSLCSKRFRGVFCTKKPIFVFLDAREMGRERNTFYFALVPISASETAKECHGNACYAGYQVLIAIE